jgi:hypothetical protein
MSTGTRLEGFAEGHTAFLSISQHLRVLLATVLSMSGAEVRGTRAVGSAVRRRWRGL